MIVHLPVTVPVVNVPHEAMGVATPARDTSKRVARYA